MEFALCYTSFRRQKTPQTTPRQRAMQTDDIQNEEEELLSETCRRLAARLADLIDRTMNLYERDLAAAEEKAKNRDDKPERTPCFCADQGAQGEDDQGVAELRRGRPRPPRNTEMRTSRVSSLKGLVSAMEGLLRCAKLARELEKADQEENFTGFTGEEIAQMLGEEYEGGSKKSNIDNPPSHPTFQTFSPRTQAPP